MPRFLRLKHAVQTYRDLFASSRSYRWTTIASLALVACMVVLPLVRLLPTIGGDPFIPLHYNIYFGVDRFGPWYDAFAIPGVGVGLLLLNLVFEGMYFRQEHALAKFFAVATLAAESILFISMVFIVLLNL